MGVRELVPMPFFLSQRKVFLGGGGHVVKEKNRPRDKANGECFWVLN